jgi:hypothetical protein
MAASLALPCAKRFAFVAGNDDEAQQRANVRWMMVPRVG